VYPEIGAWYRRENGSLFEVVAVDEEDGTIEIQYFDATIEEVELDRWQNLQLESVVAPEDWSGSVDIGSEDLPESENQSREALQSQLISLDQLE